MFYTCLNMIRIGYRNVLHVFKHDKDRVQTCFTRVKHDKDRVQTCFTCV